MSDLRAFLETIAAQEHPGDNTPRLVMADWLEENGEGDWAELIRLSIVIASSPEKTSPKCVRSKMLAEWCSAPECLQCAPKVRERDLKALVEPRFWQPSPQSTLGHSYTYRPAWDRGLIVSALVPDWNNGNFKHLFSRHPINTLRMYSWRELDYWLPPNPKEILWSLKRLEIPESSRGYVLYSGESVNSFVDYQGIAVRVTDILPGVKASFWDDHPDRHREMEFIVEAAGPITTGDDIASDEDGMAIRARPGDHVIGRALSSVSIAGLYVRVGHA